MFQHLLVLFLGCFLTTDGLITEKRSLDSFGEMIQSETGRNPFDFNGYGKWCGFGGSGDPVDSIDNCCRNHDHCYERVNRAECDSLTHTKVYFASYHWYKHQGLIYCLNNNECQQATCMCDKAAATCFHDHLADYNVWNQSHLAKILGGLFKHHHG
ncbi:basic phospholipase A2 Ts-G6D49-like isoform X1 [Octopus vulgaris]|uniref:Basic phospholipase A2 Ts-G6D49-like isoform X1 n=2 Tax=Octopus TaxID=6643 RepID=A0AA36EZG1_OCTVU|nr:basic phospholipase A2 RVV-VD isoform X2 [Octopus sinensis]XP_029658030.1 basic phospholipase A2 RVV-VD isoform X2 [Octopus sinensis]CAI9717503.1 basic phospholipase A2 Ts-G6D49-like isoform X1 [Octopus vulgaris]